MIIQHSKLLIVILFKKNHHATNVIDCLKVVKVFYQNLCIFNSIMTFKILLSVVRGKSGDLLAFVFFFQDPSAYLLSVKFSRVALPTRENFIPI